MRITSTQLKHAVVQFSRAYHVAVGESACTVIFKSGNSATRVLAHFTDDAGRTIISREMLGYSTRSAYNAIKAATDAISYVTLVAESELDSGKGGD